MMKKPDRKKDSLASRARAKAVEQSMETPTRRRMPAPPQAAAPPAMATPAPRGGMPAPPEMGPPPGMAPPGGAPMGMKKGGAVKKKMGYIGKASPMGTPGMKSGGKVPPKKGGLMIMIALGKKKGR